MKLWMTLLIFNSWVAVIRLYEARWGYAILSLICAACSLYNLIYCHNQHVTREHNAHTS